MSISALLRGVEKRLRSAEVLDDQPGEEVGKYVGIQPAPGKPPPSFGQWYAAIRWNGGRGDDNNPQCHNVAHGVVVTLTARLGYAPRDRHGIRLVTASDIYDLVDRIAAPNVVHGNLDVIRFANEFIEGTAANVDVHGGTVAVNGFEEPLVLGPFGPERPVGAEWVGAAGAGSDCYAIDIRFNDARRIQTYEGPD